MPIVHALEQVEEGLAGMSQVLVDPSKRSAIAYEDETFNSMLTSLDMAQWNRVYVFDRSAESAGFSNVDLDDLRRRLAPFPVLASIHRAAASNKRLADMVSATIPPAFVARFLESLSVAKQTDKLLEPQQQEALMRQLLPRLQPSADGPLQGWGLFDGARLDPAHAKVLVDTYRNNDNVGADRADPTYRTESAALMLGLARLYTQFSSSHRFGSEHDSPQALRVYAMALLNEVEALAPALLSSKTGADGRPVLPDWKQRLQGANGTFSCTAILSSMISNVINQLDPALKQICNDVYPFAWR
jgi:hypothetical protein